MRKVYFDSQYYILTLIPDLNNLSDRPLEKRLQIVGATNKPMEVRIVPNYADDPLACGPRYINNDFRCSWATHLGLFSSGILCKYLLNMSRLPVAYYFFISYFLKLFFSIRIK